MASFSRADGSRGAVRGVGLIGVRVPVSAGIGAGPAGIGSIGAGAVSARRGALAGAAAGAAGTAVTGALRGSGTMYMVAVGIGVLVGAAVGGGPMTNDGGGVLVGAACSHGIEPGDRFGSMPFGKIDCDEAG